MSKTKFKVYGEFNGKREATVSIDRGSNLVSVRPLHFRKTYEMRLEDLAELVIWRCVKAEALEKRAAKKRKRYV